MKIQNKIIQNKNIKEFTEDTFDATYRGKQIWISTDHGFGDARYGDMIRYNIEVTDILTGLYDVDTYEDFYSMKEAITYAVKGACLL